MATEDDAKALDPVSENPGDDDNISLTSTVVDEDDEQEYEVEDILAETTSHQGKHYLVQWAGFPMHQCTWEPDDHLNEDLRRMWTEKKRRQALGEEEPFDLSIYTEAHEKERREHDERHHKRNILRKQRGLPLTHPHSDDEVEYSESSEEASSSDEAAEEDVFLDQKRQDAGSKSVNRPVSRPKIFNASLQHSELAISARGNKTGIGSRRSAGPASTGAKPAPPRKTSLFSVVSKTPIEPPSATGYQGTARKVNANGPKSNSVTKPAPITQGTRTTRPGGAMNTTRTTLTMKKSVASKPLVNIFAGGKKRKSRAGLQELVSDPTKEPKLFSRARVRRLAEINSRDKGDLPPGLPLGPVDIPRFHSNEKSLANKEDVDPAETSVQAPAKSCLSPSITVTTGPFTQITARADTGLASTKKRKSVRFAPADVPADASAEAPLFSEPMEIDSPDSSQLSSNLNSGQSIPVRAPRGTKRLRSPPPPPEHRNDSAIANAENGTGDREKLSLTHYPTTIWKQTIEKKVKFGGSQEIDVTLAMTGLPEESNSTWFSNFLAIQVLEFRHTCLAESTVAQIGFLVADRLCEGTITSQQNGTTLETIAERLRSELLGLFTPHSLYNMIVYPSKCEQWRNEHFGQDLNSPGSADLKLVIFKSPLDCARLIRPWNMQDKATKSLEDAEEFADTSRKWVPCAGEDTYREMVTRRLFNWRYDDLLPTLLRRERVTPEQHHFFLFFPESRSPATYVLARWLRSCNPKCNIYLSTDAGSWEAFRNQTDPERNPGVIIFHEVIAPSIHRVWELHLYLHHHTDNYWCLSESLQPCPLFPSLTNPDAYFAPGLINFTRLFPHRGAILLTPSFLVSAPDQAVQFLEWFLGKFAPNRMGYKVVTAHNVHHYLTDVALSKAKQRERLVQESVLQDNDHGISAIIKENAWGLTEKNIDTHKRAACLAEDLHMHRKTVGGPYIIEEDHCSVVYADPSINPNDEQSLVNWFGWWTTLRLDQYRKFYVLGSSQDINFGGKEKYKGKKAELLIRIPTYSSVTVNDPDAVMEAVQDFMAERTEQPEQPQMSTPGVDSSYGGTMHARYANEALSPVKTLPVKTLKPPWTFKSDIFKEESHFQFTQHLNNLIGISKDPRVKNRWWRLFYFAISWVTTEMAIHFRDHREFFKKLSDWASFIRPFTLYARVHVAFFWTITEDWDPEVLPKAPIRRDPWLVFFRPVNTNLHRSDWHGSEAIIWDPQAKERFGTDAVVREDRLLDMQRRVIQMLQEENPAKDGFELARVWVGGFDYPSECGEARYSIDMTMRFLEATLKDFERYVPQSGEDLPRAGFKRVQPEHVEDIPAEVVAKAEIRANLDTVSGRDDDSLFVTQPMDMDRPEDETGLARGLDDEKEDEHIIFHPPRASGPLKPGHRSLCINRLFDTAQKARALDREASSMSFVFSPTMDWYNDQRKEGRSYEHIYVDQWQPIFNKFGIFKVSPQTMTQDQGNQLQTEKPDGDLPQRKDFF